MAKRSAVRGSGPTQQMDPEYAKLMGATATQGKSAMPGPLDVGAKLWEHLKQPFYDKGPNDKGLGISLDAKKYFMDTTARFYVGGTEVLATKHSLDPWVVSAGLAYRF